jgi:hypothetical protein
LRSGWPYLRAIKDDWRHEKATDQLSRYDESTSIAFQ